MLSPLHKISHSPKYFENVDALEHITENIIAPFLIQFVIWTITKANQSKIKKLYFVSRDGEILFKIAIILSEHMATPELNYLYGSRKAWLFSALNIRGVNWQPLVVLQGQNNSPFSLCQRLSLPAGLTREFFAKTGLARSQQLKTLSFRKAFFLLEKLVTFPPVNCYLSNRTDANRQSAISYLEQAGLFDDKTWAIVDTGWKLNCQMLLRAIINSSTRKPVPVNGYYIGLAHDHLPFSVSGSALSFLQEKGHTISRRREMFEHTFTPSAQTSTIGYTATSHNVKPVFKQEKRSDIELRNIQLQHNYILNVTRDLSSQNPMSLIAPSALSAKTAEVIRLIQTPTLREVKAFSDHSTDPDLTCRSTVRNLCPPLNFTNVITIILSTIGKSHLSFSNPSPWLEGSALLSSPQTRSILNVLFFLQRFARLGWCKYNNNRDII